MRITALFLTLLCLPVLAEQIDKVKPAIEMHYSNFPPVYFPDANGQPTGIMSDLFAHMVKAAELDMKYTYEPPKRLFSRVMNGKTSFTLMSRELLSNQYYWIEENPLLILRMKLFSLKPKPAPENLAAIKQSRIGIIKGFHYQGQLAQLDTVSNKIVPIDGHGLAKAMLFNGRVDYVLDYERMFQVHLEADDQSQLQMQPIHEMSLHFAVNKSLHDSEQLFETMLATFHRIHTPELENRLFEKYSKQL